MRTALCILTCTLVLATKAADVVPKVTVTGAASVVVLPKNIEVILTIKQKGADAKAAVAALKSTRDVAVEKLAALGAKAADARDEVPFIAEKSAANPMAAMQAAQAGGRLKRTPKKEGAPEVEMEQVIHVPFPLKGADLLAVTVEAETLKAAILAAKPLPEPPDAEDPDENAANPYQNIYGAKKKAGPILFEFSAPKSDEIDKRAYAEAIRIAGEKAKLIAAAAGKQSIELLSITTVAESPLAGIMEAQSQYMEAMGGISPVKEKRPDVVSGDSPALTVQVTVTVEYQLK